MLAMQGISKIFGATRALDDVSFSAEAGEIHALLGANGAGKSTLMKVLGGLYPDAAGKVTLNGRPVSLRTPRDALAAGIAMVYQEFDLVPALSVAENVMLGHRDLKQQWGPVRFISRRMIRASAAALMETFNFDLPLDTPVERLPVGVRQLVQVLKVLSLDSRVVIFDEPTARLTNDERQTLFVAMRGLTRAGRVVIFISHYLEEVKAITDQVTILRDGRHVFTGPTAKITPAEISQHMVGHDVDVRPFARNAAMGPTVLEVRDLTSARTRSFSNVSFTLKAGEVLGLTGIVGSGRHDLTRALIGQMPTTGHVLMKGKRISLRHSHDVIGKAVGFVPEDRRLEGILPDRSLLQNVVAGSLKAFANHGILDATRARAAVTDVIKTFAVKCSGPDQKISELSGGNQQKVLLGRWLRAKVDLLILEGPTVGVDVVASEEIHQQIRAIADGGRAVLISSDDVDELLRLCDRVLVMVRGKVVRELPATTSRQQLVASIGVA